MMRRPTLTEASIPRLSFSLLSFSLLVTVGECTTDQLKYKPQAEAA